MRGIRLKRPWWLFWAWVVAAWQVSIGWVLGLPFAYGLAGAVAIGVVAWLVRGRPPLPRRMIVVGAAGAVVFIAIAYWIAHPYLYIADDFPAAKRSPHEVAAFSGPLKVSAHRTGGELGLGRGDGRHSATASTTWQEKTLFPGAVILLLAVVGMCSSSLSKRCAHRPRGSRPCALIVLELGFREEGGLLWPYRVLYDVAARLGRDPHARAPGDLLIAGARPARGRRRGGHCCGAAAAVGLARLVVGGRRGRAGPGDRHRGPQPAVRSVRQPGDAGGAAGAAVHARTIPTPQLHLPALTAKQNRAYQLASTDGFPDIVNGRASTNPAVVLNLVRDMANFPDAATVRELQEYGVRTVILHLGLSEGTPQAGAARKSIEGLPLTALPAAAAWSSTRWARRTPARARATARAPAACDVG